MLILLLAVPVLAWILLVLARTIASDGYGVRPPPRSHRSEVDDVWSPDHPAHGRQVGLS